MRATTFLFVIFVIAVALRLGFTIAYRGGLDVVPVQSIAGADGVQYRVMNSTSDLDLELHSANIFLCNVVGRNANELREFT